MPTFYRCDIGESASILAQIRAELAEDSAEAADAVVRVGAAAREVTRVVTAIPDIPTTIGVMALARARYPQPVPVTNPPELAAALFSGGQPSYPILLRFELPDPVVPVPAPPDDIEGIEVRTVDAGGLSSVFAVKLGVDHNQPFGSHAISTVNDVIAALQAHADFDDRATIEPLAPGGTIWNAYDETFTVEPPGPPSASNLDTHVKSVLQARNLTIQDVLEVANVTPTPTAQEEIERAIYEDTGVIVLHGRVMVEHPSNFLGIRALYQAAESDLDITRDALATAQTGKPLVVVYEDKTVSVGLVVCGTLRLGTEVKRSLVGIDVQTPADTETEEYGHIILWPETITDTPANLARMTYRGVPLAGATLAMEGTSSPGVDVFLVDPDLLVKLGDLGLSDAQLVTALERTLTGLDPDAPAQAVHGSIGALDGYADASVTAVDVGASVGTEDVVSSWLAKLAASLCDGELAEKLAAAVGSILEIVQHVDRTIKTIGRSLDKSLAPVEDVIKTADSVLTGDAARCLLDGEFQARVPRLETEGAVAASVRLQADIGAPLSDARAIWQGLDKRLCVATRLIGFLSGGQFDAGDCAIPGPEIPIDCDPTEALEALSAHVETSQTLIRASSGKLEAIEAVTRRLSVRAGDAGDGKASGAAGPGCDSEGARSLVVAFQ